MHQKLRKQSPTTIQKALMTQESFETTKSGRRVSPSSLPHTTLADLAAEQQQLIELTKQISQQQYFTFDKEKLGQLHEALSSHPSDYLDPPDGTEDDEKLPYSGLSIGRTRQDTQLTSSSGSSTLSSAASTGLKVEAPADDGPSRRQLASPALPPGLTTRKHGFWRGKRVTQALRSCFGGSEAVKA